MAVQTIEHDLRCQFGRITLPIPNAGLEETQNEARGTHQVAKQSCCTFALRVLVSELVFLLIRRQTLVAHDKLWWSINLVLTCVNTQTDNMCQVHNEALFA